MARPTLTTRRSRQEASNSRVVEGQSLIQPRRPRSEATVFRITAYCYDDFGKLKVANLGSWCCQAYEASVERLLDDDGFFRALESRLVSKGFPPGKCESVYVGLRNATPSRIFPKSCHRDA
jgi:hypothetical protein